MIPTLKDIYITQVEVPLNPPPPFLLVLRRAATPCKGSCQT